MMLPAFVSCSKPPEYSEIEARFKELVEASYAINDIFFGEGLATYERVYEPIAQPIMRPSSSTRMRSQFFTEDTRWAMMTVVVSP